MDAKSELVIIWMVIIIILSLLLNGFIIRYIHNKPLINITLVDLIYCDLLCWILLAAFIFNSLILVCHLSPR